MDNNCIDSFIAGFIDDLHEKSYSPNWIAFFCRESERIRDFAMACSIESYSLEFGEKYLENRFPNSYGKVRPYQEKTGSETRAYRTITHMNDYFVFGTVTRGRQRRRFDGVPLPHQYLIAEFIEYCQHELGSRKYIANEHGGRAKQILLYLDKKGIRFSNICKEHVIEYALIIVDNHERESVSKTFYSLRIFFKFLFVTQRCQVDLSEDIPHFKVHNKAKLPSVWPREDVSKLLESVDRGSPLGKRDYAMLMLAAKLAIRNGDIKQLKFDNIDWDNKRISFAQNKTGQPLTLPLPMDVGWALIDYLQNGRPPCSEKHIFVTHKFPAKPFEECTKFSRIVKKYAKLAGIDITGRKQGLHSLRHTLATRLLEANVTPPVISEILGHACSSEVETYLKVDIKGLRKCALNPEEMLHGV